MKSNPVVVIGGGGAGIIAAWKAASLGAYVVLLEKNRKLGIKLLISGGGKCNITHAGSMESVRSAFVRREARFLKPAFYQFGNTDIIRMIEAVGVATSVRQNGRVFPVSGRADDVVGALVTHLTNTRVEIRSSKPVSSILHEENAIIGVMVGGVPLYSNHVIIATGGVSYPRTGTTGDGYRWAAELGHNIVPLRPALAPIGVDPPLPAGWRGVAIRGGRLSVFSAGRKLSSWDDDILFTHEGISGPAALEMSRIAAVSYEENETTLEFDFFPGREGPLLDKELNELVLLNRNKMIGSMLEYWLPNRIVAQLLQSVGVDPLKRGHVLTRKERGNIVRLLKSWQLGRVSRIHIERGEVTAGGVSLDEVDPQSMRSRKARGLYLCGEVLDIAGPVGGYNLQAAFSTGCVAGTSAAMDWLASTD